MIAQTVLLLLALLMFGSLMAIERHIMLAPLRARTWAPRVQAALAGSASANDPDLAKTYKMTVVPVRPPHLWLEVTDWTPIATAKIELQRLGVLTGDVYLDWYDGQPVLWAQVWQDRQPIRWLRAGAFDQMPRWTSRVTAGLALLTLVNLLAGWFFVRRITAPIERLRRMMHSHAQPGQVMAGGSTPGPGRGASAEIRAMHDDYQRLMAELQRHERERALLLAGVSHDLRSPLGRIRLAAEMLPEHEDNQQGVASITRNVDLADALVASFLDYTRAAELALDEQVDAAAVLRGLVERLGRPPKALQLQAPPQLMLTRSNALLIDRLAFNLVDNAFKHGRPPVRLVAFEHASQVVIDVIDQGAGLTAAGGTRLFDAFARGDSSRGTPGLGLGLAVVQQMVGRLQGQLSHFQGETGQTVRIVLPKAAPAA